MGLFSKFSKKKAITIASPLSGEAIPASSIEDQTFAEGMLGYTIGVHPAGEQVYAPANGTITTMFETGHAVGLCTSDGVEVLIHIGIDTASLNGGPFKAHVKEGDRVHQGDLLLEFDSGAILDAGYSTTAAVIITNADAFGEIESNFGAVVHGDRLLTISSK